MLHTESVETSGLPDHVRAIIDELCRTAGVTLVDARIRGQARQLKLELDIDGPNGVTHDECRAISTGMDERLEQDEWYGRLRAVDVSSPGADTPVKFLWQLAKHTGRKVRVTKADGAVLEGPLVAVGASDLTLSWTTGKGKERRTEGVTIPASDIAEARIVLNLK